MLRITLQNAPLVQAYLADKVPKLFEAVRVEIDRQNKLLQTHIVGDKLQGQVLHHRSGKLGASIRIIPATIDGTMVSGTVEGAGGPAWYGRVHEYGGTWEVASHSRRTGFTASGTQTRLLTRGGRVRKAVASTTSHTVGSYTLTFPERSFMRSSLEDLRESITAAIQEAAAGALK